jgi:hypothetical protein
LEEGVAKRLQSYSKSVEWQSVSGFLFSFAGGKGADGVGFW